MFGGRDGAKFLAAYLCLALVVGLGNRYFHHLERGRLERVARQPVTTWAVVTGLDCGIHNRVSYRYQAQGVTYRGADTYPGNCGPDAIGRGLAVWRSARDPAVSYLKDPKGTLLSLTVLELIAATVAPIVLLARFWPRDR